MNAFNKINRRIGQYRHRKKTAFFFEQSLQLLFWAGAVFICLPFLYKIGKSDFIFRWLISITSLCLLLYFGVRKIIFPIFQLTIFRNQPSIDATALEIGQHFPSIKDEMSNAVQLLQQPENKENPFVLAAFDTIIQKIQKVDLLKSLSYKKLQKAALTALMTSIVAVASFSAFTPTYTNAVEMLLHPAREPASSAIKFIVEPGDIRIARGDAFKVSAKISSDFAGVPLLQIANHGKIVSTLELLANGTSGNFSYSMDNVSASFSYSVRAGKWESPTYFVEVIDLPEILQLQLYVKPPAYTGLTTDTLERNIGDASVLPGSVIKINIVPNKAVARANLIFSEETARAMQLVNAEFQSEFKVTKAVRYKIGLHDEHGLTNQSPIEYSISLEEDQYPLVEIDSPGKDMDLDESMEVALRILGEDDFGFSKLELAYQLIKNNARDTSALFLKKLDYKVLDNALLSSTVWDLTPLDIFPEDAVEYFVRLYDNDNVFGPKLATSKTYRLRLPSIQELFTESRAMQDEAGSSMEEVYEEARDIQEKIDNVLQNIRRNQDLKWEDEQAIKETLAQQNEMMEALEEVKENLEKMVDTLDKNDMLALETLEKYQELQELLEKIASPELQEMMQKMQDALQKMDPKQMQNELDDFQASQEEFIKNMEKTINLLKQLEAEQKLDEAIKLTEQMIDKQSEINKNVENDASDLQKQAEEQTGQSENLENIKQKLEELQQSAKELPQMKMPTESLTQAQEQANQLSEEMQEASENMQSGDQQKSQQSGQRVSQQLQQMQRSLSKTQEQMQQNQKSEVLQALKQSRRNILRLSKKQEQLSELSAKQNPTEYRDIAKQQQDLLSAMQRTGEQMYKLSEKSFFVPPQIGQKFGEAQQKMQSSINELENNRGGRSAQDQQKAMQALNGALSELQQAMQDMQGSSAGGSMLDQFLQQLQAMSQQQQGINQGTQQLGMQGQLTPSQQGQLQRLAAQQEALRRALEKMQAQKESGDLLGSLEKIGEEMREAAREMQSQQVNPKTIERQERILSRMLDAQKSVRKQEYSKKRQARTGKDYHALDPGNLPEESDSKKALLQRDLLRAMRANYSKDYKKLIQQYFDALTKELEMQNNE
ncbi:MAG: hypothetical protein DWQ05_03570 [Calditrichaeota bacterium]|nr:MAG: hypothetical protein DWQ05_03570 [Calditrichota bacterium]